jgi:hypothetical protein
VYVVPPNVNSPSEKCFVAPAMSASTRAKTVALAFDWRAVLRTPRMDTLTMCADSAARREKSTSGVSILL